MIKSFRINLIFILIFLISCRNDSNNIDDNMVQNDLKVTIDSSDVSLQYANSKKDFDTSNHTNKFENNNEILNEEKNSTNVIKHQFDTQRSYLESKKIEKKIYPEKNWNNFLDSLKTPLQVFKINPQKDTIINCLKGTKIYLPANSLVYADKNLPKDSVELLIKECTTLSDFIGEKLVTKSDNKLLETEGMIHISAKVGNKELNINDSSKYAVYFPKRKDLSKMQLFYGEVDSSGFKNWKEDTLFKDQIVVERTTTKSKNQNLKNTSVKYYKYCDLAMSYDGDIIVGADPKEPKDKIASQLVDQFEKFIGKNRKMRRDFCECSLSTSFIVTFGSSGNPYGIEIKKHSTKLYDSLLVNFIKTLPKFATIEGVESYGGAAVNVKFFHEDFKETNKETYLFNKKYDDFMYEAFQKVERAELDNYVMVSNSFGWLNCDKWNAFRNRTGKLIVKTIAPALTTVWLVFQNVPILITGSLKDSNHVFENLPKNVPVKIVAIDYSESQPKLSVLATYTDDKIKSLKEFNSFSIIELQSELNRTF